MWTGVTEVNRRNRSPSPIQSVATLDVLTTPAQSFGPGDAHQTPSAFIPCLPAFASSPLLSLRRGCPPPPPLFLYLLGVARTYHVFFVFHVVVEMRKECEG